MADRVVVVDGGSNDGSVEQLQEWVGHHPNLQIVCDDTTRWYSGDSFPWPIVSSNVNRGYQELGDVDVSIYVDADVVADVQSLIGLREELSQDRTIPVRRLRRFGFYNGSFYAVERSLAAIVDRQAVLNAQKRLGWGLLAPTKSLCDSPLWITEEREFYDSVYRRNIRIPVGASVIPATKFVQGRVMRLGHFFFTREQLIAKAQRWNRATNEFCGRRKWFYPEVVYYSAKDLIGIKRYLGRNEILDYDFLPEVRRVITEFYREGMIGGAIYSRNSRIIRMAYLPFVYACKAYRKAFDQMMPLQGVLLGT